jgi:hypothetical protein
MKSKAERGSPGFDVMEGPFACDAGEAENGKGQVG